VCESAVNCSSSVIGSRQMRFTGCYAGTGSGRRRWDQGIRGRRSYEPRPRQSCSPTSSASTLCY